MTEELLEYSTLYKKVLSKAHSLNDLLSRKIWVMVEGDSGRDVIKARKLGLFTCNVKGIDIIAMCESDAAPLIHYIEQGGTYGSLDFSRLLGYTEEEIQEYKRLLELQEKIKIPHFSAARNININGNVEASYSTESLVFFGIGALAIGFAAIKFLFGRK